MIPCFCDFSRPPGLPVTDLFSCRYRSGHVVAAEHQLSAIAVKEEGVPACSTVLIKKAEGLHK